MATICLYMDKRVKDKDGLSPIKLVVRNRGTVAYKTIGVNLPGSCWEDGRIKASKELTSMGKSAKTEDMRVRNIYRMYEVAFLEIEKAKSNKNAKQIMRELSNMIEGKMEKDSISFETIWDKFIREKVKSENTKRVYIVAYNTIKADSSKILTTPLNELTCEQIKSLYEKLKNHLKSNTISAYVTKMIAVYNWARKKGLISKDAINPFVDSIKIKREETIRRNIPIEEFRRIWNYDKDIKSKTMSVREENRIMALKVFKLSFLLCGLNIADLIRLKESDIINGRLETHRKKTGVRISVKIEPEAHDIIRCLKRDGYLIGKDSRGRDTLTYIRNLNYRLGMFYQNLTSYYARHTWATLAFDLDISDHVIAMGLSHETGKANTNHFYINNDYRKLDRANRMVIDYVEGKIELD